jgi:hypothetical protein
MRLFGIGERRLGLLGGLPGSGLSMDKEDAFQRFRAETFNLFDSGLQVI